MSKSNKICFIIIAICTIAVIGICAFEIFNHKSNEKTDSARFKEEYEAYNGLVNENNNKNFLEVEIPKENPIVYKTGKEILDVLKNENAIVYFGFSSCPWCRNVIEPLLSAAEEKKTEKVYYVDIYDMRDTYVFNGNIIPEQTKKGTDAYYDILDFMGKNLEKYYIKDEAGNMYDTGVTRLYAPTVVAVSGGEVKSMHVGTLDEQTDPYEGLKKEEKEKLKNIFIDLIKSIDKELETCSGEDAC